MEYRVTLKDMNFSPGYIYALCRPTMGRVVIMSLVASGLFALCLQDQHASSVEAFVAPQSALTHVRNSRVHSTSSIIGIDMVREKHPYRRRELVRSRSEYCPMFMTTSPTDEDENPGGEVSATTLRRTQKVLAFHDGVQPFLSSLLLPILLLLLY